MTFDQAQKSGIVNMVEHDAPLKAAPVAAEWANYAAKEIRHAMEGLSPVTPERMAKLILRHAPADSASAQLAAAQSEVGRLPGEATCHFMDIEAAIGKGRLLGGWSTAVSEVATLRRERDEAQSAYRARDNDPGQPHGT